MQVSQAGARSPPSLHTGSLLFRTADAMGLRQQLTLEVQVMVDGLDDAAIGKIALASHLHSAVDELKVDFTVLCHFCTEVRHVVSKAAAPLALVFEPFETILHQLGEALVELGKRLLLVKDRFT